VKITEHEETQKEHGAHTPKHKKTPKPHQVPPRKNHKARNNT